MAMTFVVSPVYGAVRGRRAQPRHPQTPGGDVMRRTFAASYRRAAPRMAATAR